MNESPERVEQFKKDIAEMQVRDPAAGRDRLALRGGFALMIIGIIVTIAAYLQSHNTINQLTQNDAQITALIGVAVTVMGGALFLRGSLAAFFRFWLARLIYEQKAQTDRVVATPAVSAPAVAPPSAAAPSAPAAGNPGTGSGGPSTGGGGSIRGGGWSEVRRGG